jgi:hypothetical protein
VWATIAAFSVTLLCGVAPYFTSAPLDRRADGYGGRRGVRAMQI